MNGVARSGVHRRGFQQAVKGQGGGGLPHRAQEGAARAPERWRPGHGRAHGDTARTTNRSLAAKETKRSTRPSRRAAGSAIQAEAR